MNELTIHEKCKEKEMKRRNTKGATESKCDQNSTRRE